MTASFGTLVNAVSIGGTINPAVNDYCPNIDGDQLAIPDGMQIDGSGNCYTPPPPIPEPVDVCPNIDGLQTSLPYGYYYSSAGSCLKQPIVPSDPTPTPTDEPTPVDVCSNIDGVQIDVPTDYIFSPADGCVSSSSTVDMCSNIRGPQSSVPKGMEVRNFDVCFTPANSTNTGGGSSSSGQDTTDTTPVAEILKGIAALFPENVKETLRNTPPVVAKGLPYSFFAVIAGAALILFLQSLQAVRSAASLIVLLGRSRRIAEQKDNFIALISHYMHTPITIMRNGLETLVSLQEVAPATITPLSNATVNLQQNIERIIYNVENNTALTGIQAPPTPPEARNPLKSPRFIIPVALSIILTLVANFLFGVVGEIDLGMANMIAQAIMIICAIAILYTAIRNHQTKKRQKAINEQLVTHEHAIDDARTRFIDESTSVLRSGLNEIDVAMPAIASAPHASFYMDGRQRFGDILNRLTLLSNIKTGAPLAIDEFDLKDALSQAIATAQRNWPSKQVSIDISTMPSTLIYQDRRLFDFVLTSVIDNAFKFSGQTSTVQIALNPASDDLTVHFIDTGIGIEPSKIPGLFQPFTRATSTETFDYEGLGFSLFLDRIIMEYTGGSINMESLPGQGTRVSVAIPLRAGKTAYMSAAQ